LHIQGIPQGFGAYDKAEGMKEEPPESPGPSQFPIQGEIPVFIVPQNRMPDEGQMPAYLVHTARPKFQFQKGKPVPTGQHPVTGLSIFALAPYLQFRSDTPFSRFRPSGAYGNVLLADCPAPLPGKEGGKTNRSRSGLGNEDDPGGILVQPVNQERPGRPFARKQRVQGNPHPFPALNRQTGRFIQNYTFVIFKQDGNTLQNNPLWKIPADFHPHCYFLLLCNYSDTTRLEKEYKP
jgi:hypothetical protein